MTGNGMHVAVLGQLDESLLNRLERRNHVIERMPPAGYERDYLDIAGGIDLVVIRSPYRLTREMLEASRRLRWIIRAGSGTDNIDTDAAGSLGIEIFTTPRAGPAVAELAVGLLLSVARRIPRLDTDMHEGRWPKWNARGTELRDKTIGIVGLGNIGQRVAVLARAFGMSVIANNGGREPRKIEGIDGRSFPIVGLDELLRRSEVLMLACELNDETRSLIDGNAIALLPRGAIVVNVSRGEVVDTNALVEAVENGYLGGAALDTVAGEPEVPARVRECDRIILTPHIGAQTVETHERIGRGVEEIIDRLTDEFAGAAGAGRK